MRLLKRLWHCHMYAWHRVDEYLSRCRGDYEAASHDLNLALKELANIRNT